MKVVVMGLPQTGKKTLFELLARRPLSAAELSFHKPVVGIVEIRDPRFDRLVSLYRPEKIARARIEIELLPALNREDLAKGTVFKRIAEADAICHVVRGFEDDTVYHVDGAPDARRDIAAVNAELILHDLVFADTRLGRIEHALKKKADDAALREKVLLEKIKAHLEGERPLRTLPLSPEERRMISGYPFITGMQMIVALNVSEKAILDRGPLDQIAAQCRAAGIHAMAVSAKVEAEIARLESEEERAAFLDASGIAEPAVDALTRLLLSALDLVSFFTVGPDEVRQWLVRRGSAAPAAAGVVHSDMERGFIRAEVIRYDDLAALGSENAVKEAGKEYLKGKEYVVQDGDILAIRFSV
ncbi:MAG: redox-regulated ATPase YchF [Candidatus Aureabacteria bacterium]|nr:redox-regulated ATPase YchF [Candidatus Auribacterota bacterium]NLW93823.1 redox-regulated ATPase YchF [Chlamydiota bacterium]HOE26498.1 DUF933 domain-containing protein [bacterium]HQM52583.1 DUF933 domain-containing protein [bacterium]